MKRTSALLLSLCFLMFFGCNCTGAHSQQKGAAPVQIVSEVEQTSYEADYAVTRHARARTVRVRRDCGPTQDANILGPAGWNPHRDLDSLGTGVILRSYDDYSYIVTADHVVTPVVRGRNYLTCTITITTQPEAPGGSRSFVATIVSRNSDRDLAVLTVSENLGLATQLELRPFAGQHVWSVGYTSLPVGYSETGISVSDGRVATINVKASRFADSGYYHRVTSQVYFGNSGGGLWSDQGTLIGICAALAGYDPGGEWPSIPYEGNYYIKPSPEILLTLHEDTKLPEVFRED